MRKKVDSAFPICSSSVQSYRSPSAASIHQTQQSHQVLQGSGCSSPGNGKHPPKKVGMAPIIRDGVEYEFTTVFDLDVHHQAQASKDRTNLFADKIFKITEETGA